MDGQRHLNSRHGNIEYSESKRLVEFGRATNGLPSVRLSSYYVWGRKGPTTRSLNVRNCFLLASVVYITFLPNWTHAKEHERSAPKTMKRQKVVGGVNGKTCTVILLVYSGGWNEWLWGNREGNGRCARSYLLITFFKQTDRRKNCPYGGLFFDRKELFESSYNSSECYFKGQGWSIKLKLTSRTIAVWEDDAPRGRDWWLTNKQSSGCSHRGDRIVFIRTTPWRPSSG